jgi:nucleoid DNA-binding protein
MNLSIFNLEKPMTAKKAKQTKAIAKKATTAVKVNVKVKKVAPKAAANKDKQTRIEILQTLAEQTNLTRVQVESVFDALNNVIESHMKKRGSGEVTIPKTGIKIRRVKKKASKARKMVSPLTGQEVTIAAKPARYAVKLSALKTLKEMIEQ